MAGDDNVTAKAMRVPAPEEFLAQLHTDLLNTASVLEEEANTAEASMLQARARCAAMRAAASGIGEALDRFQSLVAQAHEVQKSHDHRDVLDDRNVNKSGYAVRIPPEYR